MMYRVRHERFFASRHSYLQVTLSFDTFVNLAAQL